MADPTVTVLTTTYNRASLLPRLHESLMAQSYDAFEWLVVDDGSTDETGALIERLAGASAFEIRYVRQPNRGKPAAFNTGVGQARGRYCAVIDSDDWYEPDALSVLAAEWDSLEAPERFAEVQALCATTDGQIIGSRFPCEERMDSDAFEMSFRHRVDGDKIGMIRTDVLREFPFPEDLGRYVNEALVWYRIARRYRTRYLNRVLARKEYQPGGLSEWRSRDALERARMRHTYFEEIVQTPKPMPLRERYRAYAYWVRTGRLAGRPTRADWQAAPSRLLFLASLPPGALLATLDRRRAARDG